MLQLGLRLGFLLQLRVTGSLTIMVVATVEVEAMVKVDRFELGLGMMVRGTSRVRVTFTVAEW